MNDSFNAKQRFTCGDLTYHYYSLPSAEKAGLTGIEKLPFSLKILLENLLRHEDGNTVTRTDIEAFADWLTQKKSSHEIAYHPARVLMQDFTGVPAVVDLAAMRDASIKQGIDPQKINPLCPVDLVIDHSVQIDAFGNQQAFVNNVNMEMQRNRERYAFLRWGQQAFKNFRVVPPGTGICHQVNLEYLAKTVWHHEHNGERLAYPDTLVGTDSHTTMINGLGVLGWGVGGIEAEAAMLGQPISMLIPQVVGMQLTGSLRPGITATDLVLRITEILREAGVVGQFVEFFGEGLKHLPLADRATISNMAPEYGATCGLFPIDQETLNYLSLSGRDESTLKLVETYAKAQNMWHDENSTQAEYTRVISLDLNTVGAAVAGPKRPQDRVPLADLPQACQKAMTTQQPDIDLNLSVQTDAGTIKNGHVVIASITSCTNTSNPNVMLAAGLLAKNALAKGLKTKPWVKTSLAPGSKVVTEYLKHSDLLPSLEALGFYVVGYGCTTCIGNSGPLPKPVSDAIDQNKLNVSAVLSGNRNFEGRIHPQVRCNWLASPPLVVAFALTGRMDVNLETDAIGQDESGNDIFLRDIWPTPQAINNAQAAVDRQLFQKEYAHVFDGDTDWQQLPAGSGHTYDWQADSTYVRLPDFFDPQAQAPGQDIINARILALLGDSVTTDHISPAGAIKQDSPAGTYLKKHGVAEKDFNSYGSRRGNHEVMMRGTFANIRIRNEMLDDVEGGFTRYLPDQSTTSIYDAAMQYQQTQTPLVVIAGKEYGTGSSRDWAAKGTRLLGVKAVITESFERIHRSNLIGMGVLPCQFPAGVTRESLNLTGDEIITLTGLNDGMKPNMSILMTITRADQSQDTVNLTCRIETENELQYYLSDGILSYVLKKLGSGD